MMAFITFKDDPVDKANPRIWLSNSVEDAEVLLETTPPTSDSITGVVRFKYLSLTGTHFSMNTLSERGRCILEERKGPPDVGANSESELCRSVQYYWPLCKRSVSPT